MTFLGETEHFSGRIRALRWSILVGKQKHNVQKPNLPSTHELCDGSKFDWQIKDTSINEKKGTERFPKRNLVRLYFSFRQLHSTYHAKLK